MISKDIKDDPIQPGFPDEGGDIDIHMPDPSPLGEPQVNQDGSMTINLDPDGEEPQAPSFGSNLANHMEDRELSRIGRDLIERYEIDVESRKEWEQAYIDGLTLLGIKMEDRSVPWNGACGVFHPVLMEAVVRFQSQTIMELFPPQGPAKVKIVGAETPDLQAQSDRVKNELNYILTELMEDYRDDTELLLFRIALCGSGFRKVYYDPTYNLPAAKFVAAEDLVVAYGETSLRTCGRVTYVDKISRNEFKRRQLAGFYRDVDIGEPVFSRNEIDEKESELTGLGEASQSPDRYTVLEFHVDYDVDMEDDSDSDQSEIAKPYIIHVDKDSGKVLAIYRNWDPTDKLMRKKNYFVHYKYVPGLGFYGLGLIHIIGGLAKSSTGILRQLVDAGTLSNLPGGLKSRGLRIKGDDTPIRPGEFRDVDVGSGDIQKNIAFLPYKEPSAVLYQLLGNIVEEARRVGSVADMNIGDGKQEAPVGTTLALMERAMKVQSAVQARNHGSLHQELRLIKDIVTNFMGPSYEYNVGGPFDRSKDFSSVDVVPVSDPGATTMSQRVVQYQAVIQLASQNPAIYDMRKLNLDMLNVLGIKDAQSLVPDKTANIQPCDPVSENMAILNGQPVKAFPFQDHKSHIAVHMAMVNDPKIKQFVSQTPQAAASQGAIYAHIAEHMAFDYRNEIEKQLGTEMPPLGQQLPPDVENQLSALVAKAAEQVLEDSKDKMAQQKAEEAQQDPLVQLQKRELDIKQMAVEAKSHEAAAKLVLDAHKSDQDAKLEAVRIAAQYGQSADQVKASIASAQVQREASIRQASTQKDNAALGLAGNLASKLMDTGAKMHIEKNKLKNNPNTQGPEGGS